MNSKSERKSGLLHRIQNKVFAGLLTVIPIWVTWLVVNFLLGLLTQTGEPFVRILADLVSPYFPSFADWLLNPWSQTLMAVIIVVAALYFAGVIAAHFIGQRLIATVDGIMERIPMIQTVYTSSRKLIIALQAKPDKVQRVVLIDFPSPEMKTVGLVTTTLKDEISGRELVAVYVPTTPNPTSGYLEIVPADKVTSTSWSIDEAMSFIISGGAVAPDKIYYDEDAPSEEE